MTIISTDLSCVCFIIYMLIISKRKGDFRELKRPAC
jgi:hypothetical protein